MDATLVFYRDEACQEKEIEIPIQEECELVEKDLWYTITDIPETYYDDCKVHCLKAKETELSIALEKPTIHVTVSDAAPYVLALYDEEEIVTQWENDGTVHTIEGKRNHDYVLKCSGASNYFSLPDTHISIGESPESHVVWLQSKPFTVSFAVCDADNAANLEFQILVYHEASGIGETLQGTGAQIVDAWEGENLYYQVIWVEDGYLCQKEGNLTVQEGNILQVQIPAMGYMKTSFSFSKDSTYGLYEDAGCSIPAKDLYGSEINLVQDGASLALGDGTYYVKQIQASPSMYPNPNVQSFIVQHTNGIEQTVSVEEVEAKATLLAKDRKSEQLIPMRLQVKDAEGNVVGEVESGQEISLMPGERYILHQLDEVDGYLEAEDIVFEMPKEIPSSPLQVSLNLTPYRKIALESEAQGTYALFLDSTCEIQAVDLEGNPIWMKNGDSAVVTPGRYYLKEMETSSYYYMNEAIYEVDCLDHTVFVSTEKEEGVTLWIGLKNQQDVFLSGVTMEVMDENGTSLHTWETTEELYEIPFGILERGKTYQIVQKSVLPGYRRNQTAIVYSIPERKPNAPLTLVFENEAIAKKAPMPAAHLTNQTNPKKTKLWLLWIPGIFIVCKLFHGMKIH